MSPFIEVRSVEPTTGKIMRVLIPLDKILVVGEAANSGNAIIAHSVGEESVRTETTNTYDDVFNLLQRAIRHQAEQNRVVVDSTAHPESIASIKE